MAARTRVRLIIFDFDGVVADSEHLAMQVLAEGLSGLGLPTTADEAVQLYMGKDWPTACKAWRRGSTLLCRMGSWQPGSNKCTAEWSQR
jgi:beta-phosphoglucomutase-like phosphatase (HAD superfamily)